jgi:hypothetical protein
VQANKQQQLLLLVNKRALLGMGASQEESPAGDGGKPTREPCWDGHTLAARLECVGERETADEQSMGETVGRCWCCLALRLTPHTSYPLATGISWALPKNCRFLPHRGKAIGCLFCFGGDLAGVPVLGTTAYSLLSRNIFGIGRNSLFRVVHPLELVDWNLR